MTSNPTSCNINDLVEALEDIGACDAGIESVKVRLFNLGYSLERTWRTLPLHLLMWYIGRVGDRQTVMEFLEDLLQEATSKNKDVRETLDYAAPDGYDLGTASLETCPFGNFSFAGSLAEEFLYSLVYLSVCIQAGDNSERVALEMDNVCFLYDEAVDSESLGDIFYSHFPNPILPY